MTGLVVAKAEPRSSFTDAEVNRALTALALYSGNSRRAAKQLAAQGLEIDHTTLYRWRTERYADEYRQVQQEVLPHVYSHIAEESEALARREAEVAAKLLDKVETEIDNMKGGEASTALRNVEVAKAVNVDKASLIRGRPSEIRMELGVEDLLKAIGREFSNVLPVVDSTAEDVTDTAAGTPRATQGNR